MKSIVLIFVLCSASAQAQLVITEVMASSSHPSQTSPTPDANGDWWELTNTGATTVNLNGYKWDDTPTPPSPVSIFPSGVSIAPGESIIILEEPQENVGTWRAAWGLTATTKVINRTQFSNTGGEGFSGLGAGGDEVNLYNPAGTLVAHVEFGASSAGRSQTFLRDGRAIYGLHSVLGQHGAVASNLSPSDIGSPGDGGIHFTSTPPAYGKSTYSYPITAVKSGSTATITATGLPSFLTLTPAAGGKATLANNRPLTIDDTGDYLIQLTATASSTSTIQQYVLTILNPLPSVILNEYNAVSSTNFLNGGTEAADDDGGAASADTWFGRVPWNGGQWVEFVVLGENDGGVDMRGWQVEIGSNTGSGFFVRNTLVLSSHTAWQSVAPGTILTFIDRNTALGGLDTGLALRDRSNTVGDIWTNIWMGDPTYLTYTSLEANGYTTGSGLVSGILIDNNNTQFRVRNSLGQIVFGPAGEGVAPLSGTSSKEIFELKGHPTPLVSPIVAATDTTRGYDDGGSESTFGAPNNWLEGTTVVTQSFTNLTAPEIAIEQPLGTTVADGGSVSFGSLLAGTDTTRTFTIRNVGSATLTGLTITKDGTNAADFTVTVDPIAPLAAPDGVTTFDVKFAPATAGAKTAVIHIASNDADEASYDITLAGSAFVNTPEISVRQPSNVELVDGVTKLSFGTVVVGKTGTAKTFTIKNAGKAPLTGLAITKNGTHSADFIVTKPLATTLAAGASTTFTVKFKPGVKGTRTAAIHIKSNDADENPFDIKLTGAGSVKK